MWRFRRLTVWQRSRQLIIAIYQTTNSFPSEERSGLAAQMRRSANSIGANIAEGSGRLHPRDRARFLEISLGSAEELENHLLIAQDTFLLDPTAAESMIAELTEIRQMLRSLRNRCLRDN